MPLAQTCTLIIRQAQEADALAIGQIRVAAWQAAYAPFMPDVFLNALKPDANLESLQARLSAQTREFYLAIAGQQNQAQGFYLLGTPRFETPDNSAELWALNVAPCAWRSGLGLELMQDAITMATHFAYQRILLWCISENHAARGLYERCGFKNTGKTRSTTALTGYPLHEVCYELRLI